MLSLSRLGLETRLRNWDFVGEFCSAARQAWKLGLVLLIFALMEMTSFVMGYASLWTEFPKAVLPPWGLASHSR